MSQNSNYNGYISAFANIVTSHLQPVFDFEPHPFTVYHAHDPRSREFMGMVRSTTREGDKFDDILSSKEACCTYTLDLDGTLRAYNGFIISCIPDDFPFHIAEIVTTGEHAMNHKDRYRTLDEYKSRFSDPFTAMLSMLGAHSYGVDSGYNDLGIIVENLFRPRKYSPDSAMSNYIGYGIAQSVIDRSKSDCFQIPYRDLFHAKSQMEGWDVVVDIADPYIVLHAEEIADFGAARIGEIFCQMGFRPNIRLELLDKGRSKVPPNFEN